MLTEEQRRLNEIAIKNAQAYLREGDRLRVTKCPGTKRWITFKNWDGCWIVSKSGINDYFPGSVDRVNDIAVNFKEGCPPRQS